MYITPKDRKHLPIILDGKRENAKIIYIAGTPHKARQTARGWVSGRIVAGTVQELAAKLAVCLLHSA